MSHATQHPNSPRRNALDHSIERDIDSVLNALAAPSVPVGLELRVLESVHRRAAATARPARLTSPARRGWLANLASAAVAATLIVVLLHLHHANRTVPTEAVNSSAFTPTATAAFAPRPTPVHPAARAWPHPASTLAPPAPADDAHLASIPAPPQPLTLQEQLLLRLAHGVERADAAEARQQAPLRLLARMQRLPVSAPASLFPASLRLDRLSPQDATPATATLDAAATLTPSTPSQPNLTQLQAVLLPGFAQLSALAEQAAQAQQASTPAPTVDPTTPTTPPNGDPR